MASASIEEVNSASAIFKKCMTVCPRKVQGTVAFLYDLRPGLDKNPFKDVCNETHAKITPLCLPVESTEMKTLSFSLRLLNVRKLESSHFNVL